jgi:abortive infection bacteriophage resistance protein
MHYSKPPKDIPEQLVILEERGLVIGDIGVALHKLEHIGYFRLTGYCKYFQSENNVFHTGTTFDMVLDTYVFDRKLRLLTIDAIEKIEVSLKANISNYMSLQGGCFWYLEQGLFDLNEPWKAKIYADMVDHINNIKIRSSSVFVGAYNEKYSKESYLPSWMVFEEFTL